MSSRLEFHEKLTKVPGVKKVYFQPPESVRMEYPCIVYKRDGGFKTEANDHTYQTRPRYSVTAIDPDPDSPIGDYIANHFQFCRIERNFTANNLNHFVLSIYY